MKNKTKKALRTMLPADRCPFCKNITNQHFRCDCCGEQMFATCLHCRNIGAPSIRAPRRMITVYKRVEDAIGGLSVGYSKMCYPHCARKAVYNCRRCGKWHDRSLLHMLCREENNSNKSICKECNENYHITACSSCHGECEVDPARTDKTGTRCAGCFRGRANFTPQEKGGSAGTFKTVIKTPGATRTYGIELEVNSIHNCDNLARELGALNIEDIEFEVKRDGSIHTGFEICTFPADLQTLKKAVLGMCSTVRQYKHNYEGAGLHVHVKDPHVDIVRLFKAWFCIEGMHLSSLPMFRRQNQYCHPIVNNLLRSERGPFGEMIRDDRSLDQQLERVLNITDPEEARQIAVHGRYHTMNLRALDKYGTVEYRTHHATTDYKEISHYLTFLDKLYDMASVLPEKDRLKEIFAISRKCLQEDEEGIKAFVELGKIMGLPAYTLKFMTARKAYYDKHKDVNSKTLGVPRRFRYDNGDQPADILRRRGVRIPQRSIITEVPITDDGETIFFDPVTHVVISYSTPGQGRNISMSRDRVGYALRADRSGGRDIFIVSDETHVYAYTNATDCVAKSHAIQRHMAQREAEISEQLRSRVSSSRISGLSQMLGVMSRSSRG